MSFVTNAKGTMLNALPLERISLHTGFPGQTGANEVTGGSYARATCTFNPAAGGVRTLSAAVSLSVPAVTVEWCGVWSAAGAFQCWSPNGGNPQEFFADPATDTLTIPAHGLTDGNQVVFYADTVPAPLVEGTKYFVVAATADTFKVSASSGGSPIDISSRGGNGCVVSRIVPEVYGGSGTHTVNTWSVGLPN